MNNERLHIRNFLTFVSSMESAVQRALCHFLLFSIISLPTLAHASQPPTQEGLCDPTVEAGSECDEGQTGQDARAIPLPQEQQDVIGIELVSGTMMFGLGGVLFLNPVLLNDVKISFFILAGACALCAFIAFLTRWIEMQRNIRKA